MHWISLPLAATALAGPMPDGTVDIGAETALPAEAAGRDRIALVREENGQPKLDRQPASPERPYLIAAVDKRIDGCPVMQMLHDADDLRPLPAPPDHVKVYRGG